MLVEHHIKYKEIHGYDETVWLTQSEHKKLHRRLRKEGKCNIQPDKLHKISQNSRNHTPKAKEEKRIYTKSHRFFENSITLAPSLSVRETWNLTEKGILKIYSYFHADDGKKLIYVDIE